MQTFPDNYFNAYCNVKFTRDADGVLMTEFHTNGGPLTFTAQAHTEVVDAFYGIAQDRVNKIVILTGAGRAEAFLLNPQPLTARIVREVGYGLSVEGASAADLVKSMQAKA
jgi:hypothetical protein